jgi:hypothetical protein
MDLQVPVIASVEELFHRARIGGARVAVADVGGEEFDEAAAAALATAADDGRERLQCGTDQGRRQRSGSGFYFSQKLLLEGLQMALAALLERRPLTRR